jgi:hypothetical protein
MNQCLVIRTNENNNACDRKFLLLIVFFELCSTDKEMHKRQDMLSNLQSKAKQMASSFNMSNYANRCLYRYKNLASQNTHIFFSLTKV